MMKQIYLIRHGETPWTLSDQHTGLTDIPLTLQGQEQARRLHHTLSHFHFDHIFTSPLQRAKETCRIAGYTKDAIIDPDLAEWNYGRYEGWTTAQILVEAPGWNIFKDGAPDGESLGDIGARADRFLERIYPLEGSIAIFSSAHFLRVLTARYLGLSSTDGKLFVINPASISILGQEHDNPVIISWNIRSELQKLAF